MLWYVASSWKNAEQIAEIVKRIRDSGHSAYDFTKHSFNWADIEELNPEAVENVSKLSNDLVEL